MGQQGHRAGRALGEREIVVAGYNTIGAAMLVYGDDRGRAHLEQSLALAREAALPEWIAGAFSTWARRAARCTGSPMPTAT